MQSSKRNRILLIFLVILVMGCSATKTGNSGVTSKDFHKGTSGVVMKFSENSPPKEVYELSDFILGININNQGAHDISKGIITFNVERDYIELPKNPKDSWQIDLIEDVTYEADNIIKFNLLGKNIYSPEGEQGNIFLTPRTKALAEQSQSLKSTISATSCYKYETLAVTTVCIDTDITDKRIGEKGCIIRDISLDSQGAPIAVTKVEYQMLPRGQNFVRPEFFISIENKGNGELIKPSDELIEGVCGIGRIPNDEDSRNLIFNIVNVKAFLSTGFEKQLKCEPEGEEPYTAVIKLKDGKGSVKCSYETGIDVNEGTYTTPLQIIIEYGYTFTISQEMRIKKPE